MIKLSKWESKKGVEFLKKAGIKQDQIILDFGCNVGNYTIPAAIIVKEKGIVFAIDEDDHTFGAIDNKAKLLELNNIQKLLRQMEELNFDFADYFFDFIMLYDVLHYLNFQTKEKFL